MAIKTNLSDLANPIIVSGALMSPQISFYSALEAMCTKYFIDHGKPLSLRETLEVPKEIERQKTDLFEQLLLFETVALKVRGENLPLAFLLQFFGERGIEELLEQGAFKFVQWKCDVLHLVSDIPGVEPLAHGNMSSEAYDDVEKSIEHGLVRLVNPPPKKFQRRLVQKVAPLYLTPQSDLAGKAARFTKSAYESGKLRAFNLSEETPYIDLKLPARAIIANCASHILEYKFALDNQMTTLSDYNFFMLFGDTVSKLKNREDLPVRFNELAKLENFPDLKALYPSIESPLINLPRLRTKRSSQKFRQWLSATTESNEDIAKEYLFAVLNPQGPLTLTSSRLFKSIVMTSVGAALGAGISDITSGAAMGSVAGFAGSMGLDLVDEFVLGGLSKGWSPRMFFDDLRKLPRITPLPSSGGAFQ